MDFPGQNLPDDATAGIIAAVEAELEAEAISPIDKLKALASSTGNIAEAIAKEDLQKIGAQCVDDYDQDKKDRKPWEDIAQEALDAAVQEKETGKKTFPWSGASNVNYPILASAMLQFNARAYPAIVKGDEPVLCKVVGRDNGRPQLGPDGQPMMLAMTPEGPKPFPANMPPPEGIQTQPMWQVPPGAKVKRAKRVAEYMNITLMYRMKGWEEDTDALLQQLPVVGCAFRKVLSRERQKSAMVSALRILVPKSTRSLEKATRITEEIPDVYPATVMADIRSGRYLDVDVFTKLVDGKPEPQNEPRLLLEQHCQLDLDEDDCPEPYIVTLDHETRQILRIEANFGPEDIVMKGDKVVSITPCKFYIKYPFWPNPKGDFYDLGLGHLLKQLGEIIDTCINQLMDAGTAQTAGGGFIASGVRLQSRGQGSVVRMAPGEYKTVDVSGDTLRNAIVERTLPNVSPVTFQVLDLILGAAKELASIKDVITGDASNNGQVGTTLALIEQGLQVFNAIYKRVFRALKEEFQLLYENIAKYGGEEIERDYLETLDDPEANFKQDFSSKDLDIRPVSDPSSVTHIQRMAKAQWLMSIMPQIVQTGGNGQEIMKRVLEAADTEDVDKIYPEMTPEMQQQQQEQMEMQRMAFEAEMRGKDSKAARDLASARKEVASAVQIETETQMDAFQAGAQLGSGGLPGQEMEQAA